MADIFADINFRVGFNFAKVFGKKNKFARIKFGESNFSVPFSDNRKLYCCKKMLWAVRPTN